MTLPRIEAAPKIYARIAGLLYLLIIVLGAFGQIYVRGSLVVSGDAAASANRILAAQTLWRIGITGDIIMHVFDVFVMLIFFGLLVAIHKELARIALLLNLVQTAVLVANKINLVMALLLVESAASRPPAEASQLQGLASQFIRLHDYGFGIGLIFFGCACLVYGYLIYHSGFLPRLLGVLLALAGLSYLANSFTLLLAPTYADMLLPVLALALIGELALAVWLILKGVDAERWQQVSGNAS